MLTGRDNSSYDFIRVIAFGVFCTIDALEIYETVVLGHEFNPIQLATAVGILLSAAGLTLCVKKGTEPS